MMSMVAIKGMKMPRNCMECPLTYPRWDFDIGCKCCKAIIGHHEEYGEYKTTRHPDCPLVEIVTCEHCKYCVMTEVGCYCDRHVHRLDTHLDKYCADAERRE